MKCATTVPVAILLIASGLAYADLPGTMNFQNMSAARVNQTTAEDGSGNEKEVELGDFDEDGDIDVVVGVALSDFGDRRNKLYRNDGGILNEVPALIPGFNTTKVTRNVFLRDYSGDGHLDIYVVNDQNSNADQVFVAQWSGGSFQSFQDQSGRIPGGGDTGSACSGVSRDFDEDGDMDVFCGNYPGSSQDRLMDNNNNVNFADLTGQRVPPDSDYTVDVACTDLNGDGQLDLLIANDFGDQNYIYYNNLNNMGSATGDFRYGGSGVSGRQSLGSIQSENAMEPGDFDNDGDMDFYWSDRTGNNDEIRINNGNLGSGMVSWATLGSFSLPPEVSSRNSRKATVADLNDDGRVDIVVMAESDRLAILRNTSVGGQISFVEWTPRPAFPTSATRGWHAAVFDTNNDGDLDILVGGWNNEHLFENVDSNELEEDALPPGGGSHELPSLYNLAPIAVVGHAANKEVDTYAMTDSVGGGSYISVVLNGPADYRLEILNSGGSVVASSDRGGVGVEEAIQHQAASGSYQFRVTVLGGAGSPADIDGDGVVGFGDLTSVLAQWGPCPGCPADIDGDGVVGFGELTTVLAQWGPVDSEYILEVLARNG